MSYQCDRFSNLLIPYRYGESKGSPFFIMEGKWIEETLSRWFIQSLIG